MKIYLIFVICEMGKIRVTYFTELSEGLNEEKGYKASYPIFDI